MTRQGLPATSETDARGTARMKHWIWEIQYAGSPKTRAIPSSWTYRLLSAVAVRSISPRF